MQPLNSLVGGVTNNDITYGPPTCTARTSAGRRSASASPTRSPDGPPTLPDGGPDPITQGVTDIGAFHGRPITVAAGSKVVIDDQDTTTVYAAHEDIGMGHVFTFFDEWVTYTSQWPGGTAGSVCASGCQPDAMAGAVYQVPQFWENAVNYAAQATMCPVFKIGLTLDVARRARRHGNPRNAPALPTCQRRRSSSLQCGPIGANGATTLPPRRLDERARAAVVARASTMGPIAAT